MTESKSFGAKTTICGGGRYDGLVQELDGPETPGFGFGLGIERLVLLMKDEQVELPELQELDVYVVGLGEETEEEVLKLSISLRQQGYSVDRDFFGRKAKPQFKNAQKYGAKVVITLGEEELETKQVPVKVMKTGKEVKINLQELYEDFDSIYRQITMDTTAIDEYFGK